MEPEESFEEGEKCLAFDSLGTLYEAKIIAVKQESGKVKIFFFFCFLSLFFVRLVCDVHFVFRSCILFTTWAGVLGGTRLLIAAGF